jgi:hypothetical protein
MIPFLQDLPIWLGMSLVLGIGILLSTGGTLLVNAIFTPAELIENNVVGGFKFAFLAQIVATLIAFSVVDSATRFSSFQLRAEREISAISLLGKMENILPSGVQALNEARRAYLQSVIDREWPAMANGDASPETEAALQRWYVAAISIKPETWQQAFALTQYTRLFGQLVESRIGRITDASSPFEFIIWTNMFIAVLITIGFNWFFGSNSLGTQILMGAMLSAGVMSLVYLAIILASPVRGEIGLKPLAYVELLKT